MLANSANDLAVRKVRTFWARPDALLGHLVPKLACVLFSVAGSADVVGIVSRLTHRAGRNALLAAQIGVRWTFNEALGVGLPPVASPELFLNRVVAGVGSIQTDTVDMVAVKLHGHELAVGARRRAGLAVFLEECASWAEGNALFAIYVCVAGCNARAALDELVFTAACNTMGIVFCPHFNRLGLRRARVTRRHTDLVGLATDKSFGLVFLVSARHLAGGAVFLEERADRTGADALLVVDVLSAAVEAVGVVNTVHPHNLKVIGTPVLRHTDVVGLTVFKVLSLIHFRIAALATGLIVLLVEGSLGANVHALFTISIWIISFTYVHALHIISVPVEVVRTFLFPADVVVFRSEFACANALVLNFVQVLCAYLTDFAVRSRFRNKS